MLVLIGVAAAFRTFAFPPHMTKPSVASKLAQTNHPVAVVPPQWLPVLLNVLVLLHSLPAALENMKAYPKARAVSAPGLPGTARALTAHEKNGHARNSTAARRHRPEVGQPTEQERAGIRYLPPQHNPGLSLETAEPAPTLIMGRSLGNRTEAEGINPHTAVQLADRCHVSNVAHGTCLPDGRLHLNFSNAKGLCVLLLLGGGGRKLCFCPRDKVQFGYQSRVLFDSLGKWVLKVRHGYLQPEREACFLRRLRDVAWAPQLLCHSERGMVFEAMGEPVNPQNLPYDWQAQTATILTDLHARGIRHNDIWNARSLRGWMYGGAKIEVMVRRTRLSLVDFGWATSHDGWRCGDDIDDRLIPTKLSILGTADVGVTHLLAQYEALRDDLGLDQINASLSFCGASSVILPTPLNSHPGRSFLYDNGSRLLKRFTKNLLEGMPNNCTHGTAGYWDMPAPKNSPMGTSDKIPDKANAFGTFGNHLQACMVACRSCSQCAAFTPSMLTGKCHWSNTCEPLVTGGDAPVWHGGAIPTFSRGVPWGVPARHEHAVRTFRRYGATLRAIINAPAGHCGGTDVIPYAPPRCANEELGRGGWHLRELIGNLTQTGPLAAAGLTPDIVARCAAACAVCSTCAFFSVNLYNDDCSWYASCDLLALSTTPGGYRTFQMPLRGANQTAIRAKEKRRPKSAVKKDAD